MLKFNAAPPGDCPELQVDTVAASTHGGITVPTDNEQGFQLTTAGTCHGEPFDFHGLALIAFHEESQEMANPI
ncbi:hypothetical protein [Streptomyces sp. NPDC060198]|uniref:hypothetical protein n=1 Tax=Streptomyces sp. NPDC060198 TaxID=3347070 RepID=UPI003652AB68